MLDGLFSQLLDFGSLGILAGFLIWLYIGMQRRMDLLSDKFTESLDKINADYDSRIEAMRERYDIVIQGIRDEATTSQKEFLSVRERVREGVVTQLNDNSVKLDSALDKLNTCLQETRAQWQKIEIERRIKEGTDKT